MRRADVVAAALAALVAALAWLPVLSNGFVWDDRALIVESPWLAQPGAIWKAFGQDFWGDVPPSQSSGYYRPLVIASFAIDRHLHGLEPRGYHATNLLLHVASTALLAVVLAAALALPAGQAFLGAALFGVHPALAESVAWISGRTDALAVFFLLACLLADMRRERMGFRLAAALCWFAALLAKETAAIGPALLVLAAQARGTPLRRAALERWELLLVLLGWLALRHVALGAAAPPDLLFAAAWGAPMRFVALLHIVGILFLPMRCRLEYGGALPASELLPSALAGAFVLAALVLAARRATTYNRTAPLLGLALVALAPAALSILARANCGDRLAYLPAAFLLPACLAALACRLPARVVAALAAVAVVAGGAAAPGRARAWRDDRTYWERAAAAPHASALVHLELGRVFLREGLLEESVQELNRAAQGTTHRGPPYLLGLVYMEIGCDDLAARAYRDALALDPTYFDAATNLVSLLVQGGRLEEAETALETALPHAGAKRPHLEEKLRRVRALRGAPAGALADSSAWSRCGDAASAHARLLDAGWLESRARDRLRRQRFVQAEILARAAVHRAPESPSARGTLAEVLAATAAAGTTAPGPSHR